MATVAFTCNGIGKTDSTGTYNFLCDGATPGSPVLSDGHALYTPGLSENKGGVSRYYSNDRLGNLWTVDGASKSQVYYLDTTGFGATLAASGSGTVFGFGGGNGCQTDADVGIILMGHRYYDPRTGRFLSQDPVGDGDNWYAYCENNPVNATDPSGLETKPVTPTDQLWMMYTSSDYHGEDHWYTDSGQLHWQSPDGTINSISGNSVIIPGATSGLGLAGIVDDWVTFGTIQRAGQVAGDYDSGKASRGAAIGAGALAVGAIVITAATRGEDVEGEAEAKAANYLTKELMKSARQIEPVKQAANLAFKFGGKARNWEKLSTRIIKHPISGEDVEIHWFQNLKDNKGLFDIKWKLNPYE